MSVIKVSIIGLLNITKKILRIQHYVLVGCPVIRMRATGIMSNYEKLKTHQYNGVKKSCNYLSFCISTFKKRIKLYYFSELNILEI